MGPVVELKPRGKFVSQRDKDFDLLSYIINENISKSTEIITEPGTDKPIGYTLGQCYLTTLDGINIYPKALTGAERDEVTGEIFSSINPKHKPYMKYGATQFIQLLKNCSKEQAQHEVDRINQGPQEQQAQGLAYETNSKGTPLKIVENLKVLYDNMGVALKYNELTKEVKTEGIQAYEYADFITKVNTHSRRSDLNLTKDNLWDFSECISHDNAYNPVLIYLDACLEKYQSAEHSTSYIQQLLDTIHYTADTSAQDKRFNEECIIKWLLSGIHIAHNQGHNKAEFTIVFKGAQGCGKTRWFTSLIPQEHRVEFFKEGAKLNLASTDSIRQATGAWLCELGEVGGTLKQSDRNDLKNFITASIDEYRTPYARQAKQYPRRTFFACTVNDEEFLRDDTGNRRFVVIEIEKTDYNHSIDVDMLWGELMALYATNSIDLYLTTEQQSYNNERSRAHLVKSSEQILLEEYLPVSGDLAPITATAVANYMQEQHGKVLDVRKLGKALKCMGYEQNRNKKTRYYLIPFIPGYSMPL